MHNLDFEVYGKSTTVADMEELITSGSDVYSIHSGAGK